MTPTARRAARDVAAGERRLVLDDPRAIRALAHPARLGIIDELYAHREEKTASELAEMVGLSASATSYHLRALERHGLVVRAESRIDGRERPWKAAADSLTIDSGHPTGSRAAEAVLLNRVLRRLQEDWASWAEQVDEPEEWAEAATLARTRTWLTAEEAVGLGALLQDSIEAHRDRTPQDHPVDAREVLIVWSLVPQLPGRAGGA